MPPNKPLIRTLTNLQIPSKIAISPTKPQTLYATHLTWSHHTTNHPVSTLWLATTNHPDSAEKLTSGDYNDHSPAWSPDGECIAFISDRAGAGCKWAVYLAASVEGLKNGGVRAVTAVENEGLIEEFRWAPDGGCISFVSADGKSAERRAREERGEDVHVWGEEWAFARLKVVDVATGYVKSVDVERHVTGHCWSPDGHSVAIVSSETPDGESAFFKGTTISVVQIDGLGMREACHLPGPVYDLTWTRDGLFFRAGVPVDKPYAGTGVYMVDFERSTYTRVAFGVDEDAEHLTEANGKAVAMVHHRLESRVCLLDGQVLYSRKEELEAFDVRFGSTTDETIIAVATSNVTHPVEVYSTTPNSTEMLQLSNHGSAFKPHQFGTCKFLTCPSADETIDLDALFLSPTSPKPTEPPNINPPLPTIVLIHGGPATRLTNAFNTYYYMITPYLLSLGHAILLPNYRGSSGRGTNFASHAIGSIGTADYNDIIAATNYAVTQGLADPNRLAVGGWSHGGFLTNLCSVRNGEHGFGWKFKAAVSGAGICDTDAMALTSDLGAVYLPGYQGGRVPWNSGQNDTRNREASALWGFKGAVQRSQRVGEMVIPPMLLLHGAEDKRCPVSQTWGMRRALESAGLPFECVVYPRQGHFLSEQTFWVDLVVRIGGWCDRYIGYDGNVV